MAGSFHGTVGRHQPFGGVATERGDVTDAVAGLEFGDAGTHRDDFAGAFVAGDERQADRRRVHAHAKIGIDEIDAASVLLHPDLARPRRGNIDLLECQNLGSADFMNSDCSNHFPLLSYVVVSGGSRRWRATIGSRRNCARERLAAISGGRGRCAAAVRGY